jgi:hypothetical protein
MLISTPGALYSMAAANMLTLIVLPKRRGVLMSTSCWMWLQLFRLRISHCSRENLPAASLFQKMRAHARMKSSWNSRWW